MLNLPQFDGGDIAAARGGPETIFGRYDPWATRGAGMAVAWAEKPRGGEEAVIALAEVATRGDGSRLDRAMS